MGMQRLDTLSEWLSLRGVTDENSSSQALPHMKALRSLARDTGAALLLLHHSTKDGAEYRGSTAIGGGVDVVIHVSGSGDIRRFSPKGRVHADAATYRFDGLMYHLVGASTSTSTTPDPEVERKHRIWMTIDACPGCTLRKIRKTVPGDNKKTDSAIARLVSGGFVENRGTDKKSAFHTVLEHPDPRGGAARLQHGKQHGVNKGSVLDSEHNAARGQHGSSTQSSTRPPSVCAAASPSPKGREAAHPTAARRETPVETKKDYRLDTLWSGELDHDAVKARAMKKFFEADEHPLGDRGDRNVRA